MYVITTWVGRPVGVSPAAGPEAASSCVRVSFVASHVATAGPSSNEPSMTLGTGSEPDDGSSWTWPLNFQVPFSSPVDVAEISEEAPSTVT